MCLYLQEMRQKYKKEIKRQLCKNILDKQINLIKYLKTAGYLDVKDQGKIK